MLDSGMGPTKVNSFIPALNIPTISKTSLKRYERCVGVAVEELAHESCANAIKEEKMLTLESKEP